MNKTTFQNLVIPLNQKEQYYLEHPENRMDTYRNVCTEGFPPRFALDINTISNLQPGAFFDGQNLSSAILCLPFFFNKQTRFSIVPEHIRSYLELKYVYSGHCTAILGNNEILLSEGDFILLDINSIHRIMPTGEKDLVFNFSMERSYFDEAFIHRLSGFGIIEQFLVNSINSNAKHDNYVIFHTKNKPNLKELVENMLCEYLDPGVGAGNVIESYLSILFIELMRSYQIHKEKEYRIQDKNYITEIIQYIQEHCATVSLKEAAAHFNYHPDYLSRLIKKSTGHSFQSLRTSVRMEQAAALLLSTNLPVYQIAEQTGYLNLNSFYKKFEQQYHCKPSVYRKKI